jgi:surface carbohydrate biosynthesis protein
MQISKYKIKYFYTMYLKPPKVLKKPSRSDIVVYDLNGIEILKPYLLDKSFTALPTRGESINLYIIFKCITQLSFWRANSFKIYISTYISQVEPKVVITFTDTDKNFYTISKQFPDVKTIMIQNGFRSISGDIFDSLEFSETFRVDYILSMNEATGAKYLDFMEGEVISIGSFKNNICRISNQVSNGCIMFVSQWQPKPAKSSVLYIENDGTPVTYNDFMMVDQLVMVMLSKWCTLNAKELIIVGRANEFEHDELQYYLNFLPAGSFKYFSKIDSFSNYRLLDEAEIVVFIDSTLGYEAIGRSKRAASFSWRKAANERQHTPFAWPLILEPEGVFWSNTLSEERFNQIMNYLLTASNTEWEISLNKYQKKIMEYDPDNSIFISLLDKLILSNHVNYD